MTSPEAPLALSIGEPSGIGPDIALAAWVTRRTVLPPFLLIGDPACLAARARLLGLDVPLVETDAAGAARHFAAAMPVEPLDMAATARAGQPDASSAPVAIAAIRRAVELTLAGRTHAVVTNPIAKSVLTAVGFPHPGHTEFLAALAQEACGQPLRPVMMIWSEKTAVVPVTIHIPLAEVPKRLTTRLIVETARITAADLMRRFAIAHPRLAIAGLNPHAGEGGTLGREDEDIVRPAVEALCAEGLDARGPLPADTLFHAAARADYDVVLGMYHDQVLAPAKALAFEEGVNITLGLPFVRTSPDHGTAFSLAGTGKANPSSLIAALKLAARLLP